MEPQNITLESLGETKEGKFVLQNKRYLLTYKWHIPKDDLTKAISNIAKVDVIFIAHETGDETVPYNHTHVVVEFSKALRKQGADANRTFDIPGTYLATINHLLDPPPTQEDYDRNCVHPNIKFIKYKLQWENSLKYLGKEDKDCAADLAASGLLADQHSVYKKLLGFEGNMEKALNSITSYSDVNGLITAMRYVSNEEVRPPTLNEVWQEKFLDMLKNPSWDIFNPRTVIWFYDGIGATGKSNLASYLAVTEPKKFFVADNTGGVKDFAEILKNAKFSGWSGEYLLLDLPRDACTKSFYAPIECYKNNRITGTKYSGATTILNPNGYHGIGNQCIVFANFWPQYNGKISVDRWRLFSLKRDESGICDMQMENAYKIIGKPQDEAGAIYPTNVVDGEVYGFQTIESIKMHNSWNHDTL